MASFRTSFSTAATFSSEPSHSLWMSMAVVMLGVVSIVLAACLGPSADPRPSSQQNQALQRETGELSEMEKLVRNLEAPVIISMTTIPERLKTSYFQKVIDTLLRQKPDAILLNIPLTYRRTGEFYVLPEWIKDKKKYKKVVVANCQDEGPVTKILGGLDHLPDRATVIIVDDDLKYKEFLVSSLTREHQEKKRNAVTCYNTWKEDAWLRRGQDFRLPGGFSGCVGGARQFKQLAKLPQFKECRLIDDHWLGWAYHELGIPVRSVDETLYWTHSIYFYDGHPPWYELWQNTDRKRQQSLCLSEILQWKKNQNKNQKE